MEPMEPLDPELGRLVHDGMVQAVPSPAVQERVLQGLLARLGSPAPWEPEGEPAAEAVPVEPVSAAASGAKTLLAVALGGAALLGIAWGVAGGRGESDDAAAVTEVEPSAVRRGEQRRAGAAEDRRSPESISPPSEPSRLELTTPPTLSIEAPSPDPASPPTKTTPRARSESSAGASDRPRSADAPVDALDAEIRLVAAADRALAAKDARQALVLAREHALAHPHGQLVLERTAIELSARCLLAEPDASAAAATFLREHATAPAAAKVRARCPDAKNPETP